MKKPISVMILLMIIEVVKPCFAQTPSTPMEVLTITSGKLTAMQTLSYHYQRELSYPGENYFAKQGQDLYLDFVTNNNPAGCRFIAGDERSKSIYNGTELFNLNLAAKTFNVSAKPSADYFGSFAYFYNSLVTLRNALPLILKDPAASAAMMRDTIADGSPCYFVTLDLDNRILTYLGEIYSPEAAHKFYYEMLINKKTFLPYQVISRNRVNRNVLRTTFTQIDAGAAKPSDESWYYSTYQPEYARAEKRQPPRLIQAGTKAPEWTLPVYRAGKRDSVSSAQFRGKFVLLDFWIKNCGHCMEAFPEMQAIQAKFGGAKFQLISVNAYDPKEDIAFFYNRNKPNYPMLYDGEKIAEKYGVSGYPSIVLLDREGKVVYSEAGFDRKAIEKVIEGKN